MSNSLFLLQRAVHAVHQQQLNWLAGCMGRHINPLLFKPITHDKLSSYMQD